MEIRCGDRTNIGFQLSILAVCPAKLYYYLAVHVAARS